MSNSLNLASKPFSNRILPWALTAIILFVSLVGLIVVVRLTTTANRQAEQAQVGINALKQREQALLETAKSMKALLTTEQQRALPSAHQLVDRKGFSWSALLAELEAALPNDVKVSRISVQDVMKDGEQTIAQLDLAVFAKSANTVNAMISSMHQQGIFQLELRNQNLQKGRGETGTEYEFFVVYRARSSYSSDRVAGVNGGGTTGEARR